MQKARTPTIVDVAREADVSVSTAGRVLGSYGRSVTPDLSERVHAAAARIGYVPNTIARRLRDGNLGLVGLVVGSMVEPYYGEIGEAVTEAAQAKHGLGAVVSNMQRDPILELAYCQQFLELRVRGILLSGGGFDQNTYKSQFEKLIARIVHAGIPVASLAPRGLPIPTFCVDNRQVGRLMASHILDHGHRQIAVIMGPVESVATELRLRGVMEALEGKAESTVVRTEYTINSGRHAAQQLLDRPVRTTGFLVGSDMLALGVMDGLRAAHVPVPDSASVIGVGNTRLSNLSFPALTSIDIGIEACARAALDYTLQTRGGLGRHEEFVEELAPTLIEGATVAPLGT